MALRRSISRGVIERQSNATGWRLDDEGRLVREKIPRMTRRLVGWDYRDRGMV